MEYSFPKVSVITVVYNDIKHIESTIKNVLNQDYKNLEYIIVDGGSTDGTLDIIKKYEYKITRFISEPDSGLYDAMNKGTRLASGEWIIFRNSGDYFIGHNAISSTFQEYIDRGEGLICGKIRMYNQYGYKDFEVPLLTQNSYWDGMPFWHPSTYIRRSLQLVEPYDVHYRNSADFKFFLKCLNDGVKYKLVDQTISLFNTIEGTTADNYIRTLNNNLEIFKELGADSYYIRRYKIMIIKYEIYGFLRLFRKLFYSPNIRKDKLKKMGWVESDISDTLKDV